MIAPRDARRKVREERYEKNLFHCRIKKGQAQGKAECQPDGLAGSTRTSTLQAGPETDSLSEVRPPAEIGFRNLTFAQRHSPALSPFFALFVNEIVQTDDIAVTTAFPFLF